jgi:hypothetical protein
VRYLHCLRVAAEAEPPAGRVDPFEALAAVADVATAELDDDGEWEASLPQPADELPFVWWRSLLTLHAAGCALPPGACPVPCCGRARVMASNRGVGASSDGDGYASDASDAVSLGASDAGSVREAAAADSSRGEYEAAVGRAMAECLRERLNAEAKGRLAGAELRRQRGRDAAHAALGPERGAALELEEANAERRATKRAAAAEAAERRRKRRLFKRVAQAIRQLVRTSPGGAQGLAEALRQARPRRAYVATQKELDDAVRYLERCAGDRPIHDALGLPLPGDLSTLKKLRPMARLEVRGFEKWPRSRDVPTWSLPDTQLRLACST